MTNPLTKAIQSAKDRTGKIIAVAVKKGKAQIQAIEYDKKGKSTVIPISGWVSGHEVIPFLNKLD